MLFVYTARIDSIKTINVITVQCLSYDIYFPLVNVFSICEMSINNEEEFLIVINSDDRLLVTSMSSFHKPTFLGKNLKDSTNLVQNWIKNERIVAFR